jgi:hypothetical protein
MNRSLIRYAALAATMLSMVACEEALTVENPNAGETARVLGSANDAENLIGTYFKRHQSGLYGSLTSIQSMANIYSFQNYSSLANNCMNNHAPFSGATNDNTPGNVCGGEHSRVYFIESEVARVASNFIDQAVNKGLDLGSDARKNRDLAYAEFLRGFSLGYIAILHDSGGVVSPGMPGDDPGKLMGYREVMDTALAALGRSIAYANTASTGANGFPIPTAWIPSPTSFTQAEFVKLVRSYRARLAAGVARTAAERKALDWTAIIADAQNGITADFQITTSTTAGPSDSWRAQIDGANTWHQMPPFIIGMGDVSGAYEAWLKQPITERGSGSVSFTMVTPDLRFPQGATRAAQVADFSISSCQAASTPCKRYFVNRPAADQNTGLGWGWSNYDFTRFHSWRVSGDGSAQNGNTPYFTLAEINMLEAEGHIYKGNFAAAAALINKTRVKNGLPAITALDNTSPVPGDANCVPKFPQGNGPSASVKCGNMFEAMKWEKRMETAYVHFAAWFIDSRGWGDLAEGVPLFWAVPYQDLQARGYTTADIYGAGPGVGNAPNSVAGKSTYGW